MLKKPRLQTRSIKSKKSKLCYTLLFRVSRVSSAQLAGFAPGTHTSKVAAVASSWQRVDLIGSGFAPHTFRSPAPEADVFPLVLAGR